MKYLVYLMLMLIFSAVAVIAEANDSGKGIDLVDDRGNKIEILTTAGEPYIVINNATQDKSRGQAGGSGLGPNEAIEVKAQIRGEDIEIPVRTREEVKERVEEIKAETERIRTEIRLSAKERNPNTVRATVHALIATENLTGGIGKNVSAIAREMMNSDQITRQAEEKIEDRGALRRLFAGGDSKSAAEIEAEMGRKRERIQELKRLMDGCDCSEELRAFLQEQVGILEAEENRLRSVAAGERKSKGLFGWIWK